MTGRAVISALILVGITTVAVFYAVILWGGSGQGDWGTGNPAAWPVTVLFLLTAAGSIPWLRRSGLTRREILVIYSVLLVAMPLMSDTILFYLLPKVMLYYYMAHAYPAWETTWLPLVPAWFAPSSMMAVEGFGQGGVSVPWAEWSRPLLAWGGFMVALFLATTCSLAVLQRQWVSHERLAFPLAQIPLGTVRDGADGRRAGHLPIERAFWAGVIASFGLSFMGRLAERLPVLPAIPSATILMPYQGVGPLAGLGRIEILFVPWMFAIAYIIPKELSFSVWFLWLVRIGMTVGAIAAGAAPQPPEDWWRSDFPAPYHQALGALMALGLWAAWIGRHHLLHCLRAAFSRRAGADDAAEPLSYRWAVLGAATGFIGTVVFLVAAGCRPLFALGFMGLVVGAYIVYARVRAETALQPITWHLHDAVLTVTGSRGLLPREVISLITMRWLTFPVPTAVFSASSIGALEAFKIADAAGINQRRLTRALLGSFLVAMCLGIFVMLTGLYRYGFFNTSGGMAPHWPSLMSRHDGNAIQSHLTAPTDPDVAGMVGYAIGALMCVLLGIMRLRFWWWPLHPVGYIVAMGWGQSEFTFPFFFGWAAKSLVIRYGGLRLYRKTVPLALGVLVGDLLNSSTWAFIELATRGHF